MKPANTFSSELVRKVSKKDEYKGLNSDQVLLSILNGPAVWFNTPIIYLKRGNDSIRKLIGVPMKTKYAPLVSFFDKGGRKCFFTTLCLPTFDHFALPKNHSSHAILGLASDLCPP